MWWLGAVLLCKPPATNSTRRAFPITSVLLVWVSWSWLVVKLVLLIFRKHLQNVGHASNLTVKLKEVPCDNSAIQWL